MNPSFAKAFNYGIKNKEQCLRGLTKVSIMSYQTLENRGLSKAVKIGHNRPPRNKSMYAIVFDLDTQILQNTYRNQSYNNAYLDIRRELEGRGFDWKQGSTYFGNEDVDAVSCVLAVQSLARQYDWFTPSVRDIRMLRIEENNDLMPAIE